MSGQFSDLSWTELVRREFGRLTPEWEMKSEAIDLSSGGLDFTRPDALIAQAQSAGLSVHGHTLVWYAQAPDAFKALSGERRAFARAFEARNRQTAQHFAGRITGMDAVNEPIDADGGLRACLWSQNLGEDYVRLTFEQARFGDPTALLFLNDYDLETSPSKRLGFMRLAERLLKAGAPLGGLGTQTHVAADLEQGKITAAIRDLASLGLPVHVSELDVSTHRAAMGRLRGPDMERGQVRLIAETVQALLDLTPAQRYGLTVWAARDSDSWLNRSPERGFGAPDRPVLFDSLGRPKPAARALARALA